MVHERERIEFMDVVASSILQVVSSLSWISFWLFIVATTQCMTFICNDVRPTVEQVLPSREAR